MTYTAYFQSFTVGSEMTSAQYQVFGDYGIDVEFVADGVGGWMIVADKDGMITEYFKGDNVVFIDINEGEYLEVVTLEHKLFTIPARGDEPSELLKEYLEGYDGDWDGDDEGLTIGDTLYTPGSTFVV